MTLSVDGAVHTLISLLQATKIKAITISANIVSFLIMINPSYVYNRKIKNIVTDDAGKVKPEAL